MSPASSSNKRRWLILFSILFLLGSLVWWSRRGPTELDRYKAQLLAQGEILDIDKLAPRRTGNEPDGDASLIAAAKNLPLGLVSLKTGKLSLEGDTNGLWHIQWQDQTNTLSQAQREALWPLAEADLAARRADLLVLLQALQHPPADKGADYRNYTNYPKSQHAFRLAAGQFLQDAFLVDAHAGHTEQAHTTLLTLLDLCQSQRDEWMILAQLNRRRLCQLALSATSYGVATHTWDEPALKELQTRWENVSLLTNFFQALYYDRTITVRAFAQARSDPDGTRTELFGSSKRLTDQLWASWWFHFGMEADELVYLKRRQDAFTIWQQMLRAPHWSTGLVDLKTIDDEWEYLSSEDRQARRYRVTYLTAMLWTQSNIAHVLAETRRQQAITALALERYHLAHRHYPENLGSLAPDYLKQLPQDPWDGRSLRYRLEKDGTYTLWSVGLDGLDQGGYSARADTGKLNFPGATHDLVWPRVDPIDLPAKP